MLYMANAAMVSNPVKMMTEVWRMWVGCFTSLRSR